MEVTPINLFDLYAKISLDTSGFESGINNALKSGQTLGTRLSSAFNGVSSLGASTMKSIGIAAGAAGTALGAFAKASIDTGMEFDKSMAQVAATIGVPVEAIGELRDTAIQYGETTAFTASEAAEA